jgi:Zn-dependent peptidase ImmA (M78 family)
MTDKDLVERIFRRGSEMGLIEDLPRYSGLDKGRIQQIFDQKVLSSTEFEQLCRALAVDPASMYGAEDRASNRVPARFRAATSQDSPSPDDVRTLSLAAEQGRILAHLLNILGETVPIQKWRDLRGIEGAVEIWQEGYALGEEDRLKLRAEPGPILELEKLLRDLGIHVARVCLSSADVSAASVWEPNAVPVILLNSARKQNRLTGALRATLAHELCHLLHDAAESDMTTRMSWGTESTGNYSDRVEMRARAFAPAFLAPREQVKDWMKDQGETLDDIGLVKAMAAHWGLSFEGAVWHAKNCELIDGQSADDLARMPDRPRIELDGFETTASGVPPGMLHDSLPDEPAPLWEGWAAEVVVSALEEGCITAGRARELLTWS